jgi:hypothetical protein
MRHPRVRSVSHANGVSGAAARRPPRQQPTGQALADIRADRGVWHARKNGDTAEPPTTIYSSKGARSVSKSAGQAYDQWWAAWGSNPEPTENKPRSAASSRHLSIPVFTCTDVHTKRSCSVAGSSRSASFPGGNRGDDHTFYAALAASSRIPTVPPIPPRHPDTKPARGRWRRVKALCPALTRRHRPSSRSSFGMALTADWA